MRAVFRISPTRRATANVYHSRYNTITSATRLTTDDISLSSRRRKCGGGGKLFVDTCGMQFNPGTRPKIELLSHNRRMGLGRSRHTDLWYAANDMGEELVVVVAAVNRFAKLF